MADPVNDEPDRPRYDHWRRVYPTYPWPVPPDWPADPPANATPDQRAAHEAEVEHCLDGSHGPVNREWVVRTLGLLTAMMRVGSGRRDNYASEDAYHKERLAIACITMANVAMADAPAVVLTSFARSLAKRMDAMGLFNPASGGADADDWLDDDTEEAAA